MQITLLAVGKCRKPYLRDGVTDYIDRIRRYASLEHIEIREEPASGKGAAANRLCREGERILRRLPQNAFVVALDPNGASCSSDGLARRILKIGLDGIGRIAFVVGGPSGLSNRVIRRADWRLSLSSFTFPHEVARLVLLEQIYRAFTIMRREPYHR
ncbi:MAG: 23S rRNA (pseudouridine(1915)-N(3))-methyltransferase RlmH [Gemmatimonadota bacterium]|nr:23S rRNA (pseudouridine(1915)-N(3))-methyltransferase RlmH [Gemmatimonadota bacterium]